MGKPQHANFKSLFRKTLLFLGHLYVIKDVQVSQCPIFTDTIKFDYCP